MILWFYDLNYQQFKTILIFKIFRLLTLNICSVDKKSWDCRMHFFSPTFPLIKFTCIRSPHTNCYRNQAIFCLTYVTGKSSPFPVTEIQSQLQTARYSNRFVRINFPVSSIKRFFMKSSVLISHTKYNFIFQVA